MSQIIVVDDDPIILKGAWNTLSGAGFQVVALKSGQALLDYTRDHSAPNLILMDINMPEKDGLQAIQAINKMELSTKVVVLSGYDDADLVYRAMKLGARGYVLKTMASVKLIDAIEDVSEGKIYLPAALSTRFFEYFQSAARKEANKVEGENLLNTLTVRESEVLELLTQGVNYKTIAGTLIISETTVKTHVNNIFQKLQVNDRTNAVLYALSHGFKPSNKSAAMTAA